MKPKIAAALAVLGLAVSVVSATAGGLASPLGWYGGGACDDSAAQNPGDPAGCRYGARERDCGNAVDDDSDERADGADPDCAPDNSACQLETAPNAGLPGACAPGVVSERCADSADNDGDGYYDCADPDCAGLAGCGACVPSGAEDCSSEGDEDCDGAADGADSDCAGLCTTSWWAFWMPRCVELCANAADDDGDGFSDCADREDCAGDPACQTGCSGGDYCVPSCPEYAGYCACNPTDPACSVNNRCTPETVCNPSCPGYDLCACNPAAPSCGGCDGNQVCNPNCPEYQPADERCCNGSQVCNPSCAEYSFCLCNPTDPSCSDGGEICGNGKDDDGDRIVDENKTFDPDSPECPFDESEINCFDGIDNDEDGLIDCADVEYCEGKSHFEETYTEVKELYTRCEGGVDKDFIEPTLSFCRDEVDNDGNGYVDCQDSACHGEGSPCLGEGSYSNGCSNHRDDDGDDDVDCDDSDCQNSLEDLCAGVENETSCSDGVDNEGDGKADCADDECFGFKDYGSSKAVNEWTASTCGCGPKGGELCDIFQAPALCFDGMDNDADRLIDERDGDCAQFLDADAEQCTNRIDDDKDGATDCLDSSCYFDAACVERLCSNGLDDDSDGSTDCGDFDCQGSSDCN